VITDIWKPYYFWTSGSTYTWEQTLHPNNFYGKANKNVYFTNEKCLSGITYSYIISLNDIYQKNIMTNEDSYSLYNQYNQFDVIDRVTKNYTKTDIAVDYNVDLTKAYHKLDDTLIKPEQNILLFGQIDTTENDIYTVTNNYKLENSGFLSTTTLSNKHYSYIKGGTYKDKFMYLYYTDTSPISGSTKTFIEGTSYILKNIVTYNLSIIANKIIFTDYNIPRKLVDYSVINPITFDITAGGSFVSYKQTYKHDIHTTTNNSNYSQTDYIWINNGVLSGVSWDSKDTMIYTTSPSFFSADDYIKITFPVNDTLIYKGHIKEIDGNWLHLYDSIPPHIFNNADGDEYLIDNLSRSSSLWANMATTLDRFGNDAPASYFYDVTYSLNSDPATITITPKQFDYYKHFNHTELELEFKVTGTYTGFTGTLPTTNQFIDYKIYEKLQELDEATYTSGYTIYNTNTLINPSQVSLYYWYHDLLYITPITTTHLSNFKEYTYVDVETSLGTEKAMIVKITSEQIIIEKPRNYITPISYEPNLDSITNVDGLQNISDILYEVYLNNNFDWYRKKGDFTCRQICKVYGKIFDESTLKDELTGTTSGVTGIIYESDEYDNYVFKVYDHENDTALTYQPSDILVLGQDLKTKFPVPVKIKV